MNHRLAENKVLTSGIDSSKIFWEKQNIYRWFLKAFKGSSRKFSELESVIDFNIEIFTTFTSSDRHKANQLILIIVFYRKALLRWKKKTTTEVQ